VAHDGEAAVVGLPGHDGGVLEAVAQAFDKEVGESNQVLPAAEVFHQFVLGGLEVVDELFQVHGAGTSELEDVLVVVAHRNHAHVVVVCHQGLDQFKFVGVHVLGFVDDQHGFRDAAGFHFTVSDALNSGLQDLIRLFKGSYPTQQVKTIGVKGFDLNEVGGVPNKREQAFFKFGGGCPRKREHEELFVFHVFHEHERRQFVHQHLGLATAWAGCHHDVFGGIVVDDGQLGWRERAKQLFKLGRRHLQG